MVVHPTVCSGSDQRKHQSFASLAFLRGIRRDRWIPRTMASNAENDSIWWSHHVTSGASNDWQIYTIATSALWDCLYSDLLRRKLFDFQTALVSVSFPLVNHNINTECISCGTPIFIRLYIIAVHSPCHCVASACRKPDPITPINWFDVIH